jgi:uncharacterized protein (DUF2267 family)
MKSAFLAKEVSMQYRELVKRVQDYSGFSDSESETALRIFIKRLAMRLTPDEREDFASELPMDLQDIALTEAAPQRISAEQFVQQFAEEEDIDESRAKKQILAAWQAVKDAISPGEIDDIKAQLPNDMVAMLH